MFLLAKYGEAGGQSEAGGVGGIRTAEELEALSQTFQSDIRTLLYAPQTTPGVCNFRKGPKTCNEPSVFGTCFCSEHYGEKRKDFIRAFFKRHSIFIPKTAPLYPMDAVTDRSWETFNQVLTRPDGVSCLNTLSLIVYVRHDADSINLANVKSSFEAAGDYLGAEDAASFVNVKEFIAVFEETRNVSPARTTSSSPAATDDVVLYNASVKVWSNNQIQISGCKSVASALRITSAVVRTLQAIGELRSCTITSIKPVFANASFDFFPKQVSLAKMRNRGFLESLETHLTPSAVQVEVGEQRDLFVQYVFKLGAHKTTIKTYHKGNVIITFNNFDGLLLQQSLQAMAKVADALKIYVGASSELRIHIEPSPDFFMEPSPRVFSFSPIVSSSTGRASSPCPPSSTTAKRKFGF